MDGATPLRQWRAVTLPMLAPVNQTMLLVMFLWVFNDFNTPYVLLRHRPASDTAACISTSHPTPRSVTGTSGVGAQPR